MGTEETSDTEGVARADPQTTRVLYVDSDQRLREAVTTYADDERSNLSIRGVTDGETAQSELRRFEPDCLVTEYDLPDSDGVTLCKQIREEGYSGPVLLFTTHSPADVAREAFDAGADDFVQKRPDEDGYAFLFDKVQGAIEDERAVDWNDGAPREMQTLVALADETNDELWTAGSLDVVPPSPEDVYDAVTEVLESDSRFRATVADTTGEDVLEPRTWALETGRGAIEHQRVELPSLTAAARRLDIFRDISDEERQRSRLQRFERLLDTASDGLYSLDPNGHYTYVNESMAETLGYDREELIGMHAAEILTEEEYERGQQHVTDIVSDSERESEIMEMTVERADGTELPVAISFSPLYDDGGYDGLVGVLRDISERRAREQRLEESERRYRALAENIPDGGVAMFDSNLEYVLVEGELFDGLDYDAEEFSKTPLSEIHTDGFIEQFGPKYEAVFDGERATFEFNHAERYYRTHLVPIRDGNGDIDAGLALTLDITEQREYERELERQNERLGEFASIVSHDLRNPLNVIEGRLALYRDQGDEAHLDSVEEGIETMKHLIDDLLELARSGQTLGETEPIDLKRAATTCWDTVDTEEATLTVEGDPTIVADAGRLHQVFGNLFRNAIEHGGRDVSVSIGPLADGGGFFVADDGPGIPEDEREEVFDYGVTGSADGTGIGLAIVSEVAEAHGWDVRVTESEDGGARFEFRGVDS